jgi:hypothetical protein
LGERALASARRIGDREVEIHALNNIGSVLTSSDDVSEGRQYLTKSLDLALAADAHEHVGRAYTNLGYDGVINRQFSDAERPGAGRDDLETATAGTPHDRPRDWPLRRAYDIGNTQPPAATRPGRGGPRRGRVADGQYGGHCHRGRYRVAGRR